MLFRTSRIHAAAATALSKVSGKGRAITATLYIGALIVGSLIGFAGNTDINAVMDFIATVFTRLFSFIAVPIIAVSLISTLANLSKNSKGGSIFAHTIFYTLLTTILAALLGAVLFAVIKPANVPAALSSSAADVVTKYESLSYLEHIQNIIPNNLLQPFVAGNVLSILLVAAAFGLGIATMKESKNKEALISVISGFQELLFILIHWLINILPLGIMAFTAQLVTQLEAGIILGGLATYFGVVISSNLIQMFVILPLILLIKGLNPIKIARGMLPALAVALFSKSSAGTLPVTMASAEDNLHVDRRVSRFVLPICTTINMNGCAAFILITSVYLMQNAGIEIGFDTMLAWVFIATFAAVGNAGVPMGCYFLTLSLVSSMNIPVTLMGIILPVYAVIDMIETSLNVWSDSCVANIVNKTMQGKLPEEA
ncbi:MAG: dicarboxylate/amino acid:cation symporter [Succinivibrio dextrinosolvens]|uniref:dicarboxylate/amino acid:cation symporter n=1 Tax=Succinivibrio sp. TaxID=2053619 RepID=UPI0025D90B5A|nr:dicarboxylate/amino acid:cation symporter [uncultured Succinivibrio sp.]MDY6419402.1 dicarboxylate/amino acid:cation symporter [Succinivibrio dextrinosolvens]MDY6465234.1 dicarboxylate/amino acid:cation symporter [Succinivibrio dextrinosolvens]MDY6469527.1 dicarboxylate/amino acid:cation symporter [Succinivibrio dextrinosolvens]